ncbi:MAG: hypothetical protein EPO07_07605 [Verrucomicrobia bacterium]|nr:MAG: hypothetical protein EPO07_07605 [Verrucomicrobiota bacterium]
MSAPVKKPENPADAVVALFKKHFQHTPPLTVKVPGRLRLLGADGDQDDGLSICAAVDRYAFIAAAPRTDGRIELASSLAVSTEKFWMSDLDPGANHSWSAPIKATLAQLRRRRVNFSGFNAAIHSSIPPGLDCGNFAAQALALALMVRRLYPFGLSETGATVPPRRNERGDLPPLALPEKLNFARLVREAEASLTGETACLADPLASLFGKAWNVLSVDARFATVERTPLVGEALIVCPTHQRPEGPAQKISSPDRFRELARNVAAKLGAKSLRSVELNLLKASRAKLDPEEFALASHVIGETARVVAAERALRDDDHAQFGQYLWQSHESAAEFASRHSEETDLLIRLARRHRGCLGARAIPGATLNVVAYHHAQNFMEELSREFETLLGVKLEPVVCQLVEGAG